MLINKVGHVINVDKSLNSVTHPKIFAPLREVLVPPNHSHDKMFRLETRARIKQ